MEHEGAAGSVEVADEADGATGLAGGVDRRDEIVALAPREEPGERPMHEAVLGGGERGSGERGGGRLERPAARGGCARQSDRKGSSVLEGERRVCSEGASPQTRRCASGGRRPVRRRDARRVRWAAGRRSPRRAGEPIRVRCSRAR